MNTTPSSVKTAAYLCFAQAVLMVVGLCVLNYVVSRVFGADSTGARPPLRGPAGLALILATVFSYCVTPVMTLLFAVAGVGLLKRWGWARTATIIVSVINGIVTFPIGTLFSIAVIVMLLKPEAKAAFLRSPAPPVVPPAAG